MSLLPPKERTEVNRTMFSALTYLAAVKNGLAEAGGLDDKTRRSLTSAITEAGGCITQASDIINEGERLTIGFLALTDEYAEDAEHAAASLDLTALVAERDAAGPKTKYVIQWDDGFYTLTNDLSLRDWGFKMPPGSYSPAQLDALGYQRSLRRLPYDRSPTVFWERAE